MVSVSSVRPARVDARQNRAHILEIAGRAFAENSVDLSMDSIARMAGVGSGTLYRHFANKDALLVALLAPHHDRLEQERAAIEAEESDAARILERWIDALGDWMLAYDGLSEPLRSAWSANRSPLKTTCQALVETTDRLLRSAQRAGLARPNLSGQDIFLGALAVAWACGRATAHDATRAALHSVFRSGWILDAHETPSRDDR
ncbi:helix-turn-helix domain-containing protein [Sphingobium sp. CR2-8]|uniref:TetR/AcrR family transcriptional regulator n=1 Tax=Sphingobium sp. CR2-8 TaxID=1306534 RepID=UPI002DB862C5|nr:helix-turn-helix domain-containing protein [Sphingobium sp. CR2-8]MEC3909495.1 helix-turn-helix domain-containing protein [Sphingobium sp. CR2-8]